MRHQWRNWGFYDGVLVQQNHFPSVSFVNRVCVQVANYRPPLLWKWHTESSSPLLAAQFLDFNARFRGFFGKVQGVLVQRKRRTSQREAQAAESSSDHSEKFVVVTWCETNVAIKVCLDSLSQATHRIATIDWNTPRGLAQYYASTKTSKDCCYWLPVRW